MVNTSEGSNKIHKIILAGGTWLVGMLYVLIMASILPILMNNLGGIYDIGDFTRGIIWLGAILIAVIATIAYPVYQIQQAIEGQRKGIGTIFQAILVFIFGAMFVYDILDRLLLFQFQ